MKIIRLSIENVKRLRAVDITPDGTLQVISGRNAQGKTSVLDAIWLALGGGAASRDTTDPIRAGHDQAAVTVDLGDIVVTRTWKRSGSKLVTTRLNVAAADGAKYSSPQSMLDALVGRLSFDPLAFTRLSAKDQAAALMDLVDLGIDIDDIDAQRARLYEERRQVGRDADAIVPDALREVPDTIPDPDFVMAFLKAASMRNTDRDGARGSLQHETERVDDLRARLAEAEERLERARATVAELGEYENTRVLHERVDLAMKYTTDAEHNKRVQRQIDAKRDLNLEYQHLTRRIAELDTTKARALADATFPVPGLGFDDHDNGVTFDGIPFAQASSAEQIRVSLAMAMAMNPKLRVIRIVDGSLLDAENLQVIADMAAERDFQVWIERVAEIDEGVGVVIEDGEVA